jgi:hypothetical protein
VPTADVTCTYRIKSRTEIWNTHPAQHKPLYVVGWAEVGDIFHGPRDAPWGYRIVGPGYRSIKEAAMEQVGLCSV